MYKVGDKVMVTRDIESPTMKAGFVGTVQYFSGVVARVHPVDDPKNWAYIHIDDIVKV